MSFSLIPDRIYGSVYELEPEALRREGVRVVFADLDNTLARYREKTASPELKRWNEALRKAGVTLFLVSNSRKPTRAKTFAESLNIGFIGHAGKPKRGGFQRALARNQAQPGETVMLGDQIFTDILGAKRAGIRAWLIQPIALDTAFRRLRYGLESPFRGLCREDRRK